MKKKLIIIYFLLILFSALCIFPKTVYAEGEYIRDLQKSDVSVTVNNTTIKGIIADPVSYYDDSSAGYLTSSEIRYQNVNASDTVIYTAEYPKTTSLRSGDFIEYACSVESNNYVVKEINTLGDGATYIPIGGFVLSIPKGKYPGFASVGDIINLDGIKNIPTKAVESSDGSRIVINNTNTTRSAPMVVYYDYQFGEKTGTNIFGTEMVCTYDFDKNTFVVTKFRGFGTGDDSGIEIPDNSFVLSAYGEGYRGLLQKDELFSIGDEVKMVGFDFIRFGGTVIGEYDFINPTKEENPKGMETATSPFPAYRGENQTIIYKDGWSYEGSTGTGTNVYGYEAAVDKDGVVVELNVNVQKIPVGGYVISGHGKGRDFIRSNIVLGATVKLDLENKTYAISTTLNSYYENLCLEVNNAIESARQKIRQLYDVDESRLESYITSLNEKLTELKTVKEDIEYGLENLDWDESVKLSHLMVYNKYQLEIEKINHLLIASTLSAYAVQANAVWHRPTEANYEAIASTMKVYHDIGINLIFVETLYNGYSLFKSKYEDIFPYNTKLGTNYANDEKTYDDYLSCFVDVAREYGIEVHAWVENFYVGTQNTVPSVANHPDWILYNDDGTYIQRNEGGLYIFLDPANLDVQNALINYYLDLFEKIPDCAGLNLDYIRYPVSDDSEDTGYTTVAMKEFAEAKGMTFSGSQLSDRTKMAKKFKQLFDKSYVGEKTAKANYDDWVTFRTNIITKYVERIKKEVKDKYKIKLSTSVFASVNDSLYNKKQDWKTWIENGYIDIATPMAYYTDSTDVLTNVNQMILAAGGNAFYYAGLASSYSGLPAYKNAEQIEAAFSGNASGYVIFCSTQILGHDDVQEVLKLGANSKNSVLPHSSVDTILKASFNDILSKIDRIYIPKAAMTDAQKELLNSTFTTILNMPYSNTIEIYKIQQAVKAIYSGRMSKYAKGYAVARLSEDLKYLYDILETKVSRSLIDSGEWDPVRYPIHPIITDDGIKMVEKPNDPDNPSNPTVDPVEKPKSTTFIIVGISVILVGAGITLTMVLKKKTNKK